MDFEWDPDKSSANLAKHGVLFSEAVAVFQDDMALTIRDPLADDEMRWITVGTDAKERLFLVIYTWRDDRIRIISARPATKSERQQYEEKR